MLKLSRRHIPDILFTALILAFTVAYFLPFVIPEQMLLVTPDFARSDSWHSGIPAKYILWQALRNGTLPLWTDLLGGGYPFFADGLGGVLYLPHLIIFSVLPFVAAYNVHMIFTVFLLSSGVYAFLRKTGVAPAASFTAGVTVALSGIVIPQLTHMMMLPTVSLLPWVLFFVMHLAEKPVATRAAILSFAASQQILAGFPQGYFITWLTAAVLFTFLIHDRQDRIRAGFMFLLSFALAVAASAVQLLPSYEYLSQSSAAGGFIASSASFYSYPPVHLVTLLEPFLLGNPKLGTYPDFRTFTGSIFWENTAYVGILPLLAAGLLFLLPVDQKIRRIRTFFLILLVGSFILMLGQNSPAYIVFSVWPFNLFRVPSRFIWVFVLAIVSLGAIGLDRIGSMRLSRITRTVIAVSISLHIILLFAVWKDYHLLSPADTFLTLPPLTGKLKPGKTVFTVGSEQYHNAYFLKNGWKDGSVYLSERNLLSPNSNVLWGIRQFGAYQGRQLRKISIPETLLGQEIKVTESEATISAAGINLLRLYSVDYILSPLKVKAGGITVTDSYGDDTGVKYAYAIVNPQPPVFIAGRIKRAGTVREAVDILKSGDFDASRDVILDEGDASGAARVPDATVSSYLKNTGSFTVDISVAKGPAVLVVNETNYPGWKATLDGVPATITGANLRSIAVSVPPGNHRIELRFGPDSFRKGAAVSAAAYLLIAGLAAGRFRRKASRKAL